MLLRVSIREELLAEASAAAEMPFWGCQNLRNQSMARR